MTAQRRTLARRATLHQAAYSCRYWRVLLGPAAGVRIEYRGPGSTITQPYTVTANKHKGGSP